MLRADRDLICSELRSGNYKQGRSRLEVVVGNKSYFCCLGVICHTLIPETRNFEFTHPTAAYDGSTASLPELLHSRLGTRVGFMEFSMPAWRDQGRTTYDLAVLNDDARLTLEQIADMLEYFFEVED